MIDSKYNLKEFVNDLNGKRKTVLFVGAGINMSKGVKITWNALMDFLFKNALNYLSIEKDIPASVKAILHNAWEEPKDVNANDLKDWYKTHSYANTEFNHLIKASIVKKVLGNGYISSIQSYLYSKCNKKIIEEAFLHYRKGQEYNKKKAPFYTLYNVAKMVMLLPNIEAVISYNYDNFLTEAINILYKNPDLYFDGAVLDMIKDSHHNVKDVAGDLYDEKMKTDTIPVYHVHGFIPPPSMPLPEEESHIVLSMDEFYETSRNSYSWQTATLMHYLCHYTCIFSGLSFTDINLQRMIYYASKSGCRQNELYLLCASQKVDEDNDYAQAKQMLLGLKYSFLKDYGLTLIHDNDSYYNLYKTIGEIIDNLNIYSNGQK